MLLAIAIVFIAAGTVAAIVVILLRAMGRIGPTADAEAWSVRSPDAERERANVDVVAARLRALRVEAEVLTRSYSAPPRKEKHDA
jgi:hypothetical protein